MKLIHLIPEARLTTGSRCSLSLRNFRLVVSCGLTRSLDAASHGLLQAAFQFHLLGPFVLVGMVALALAWAAEASRGKRLVCFREARWQRHAFLVVVVIWMAYGGGRMIVELM